MNNRNWKKIVEEIIQKIATVLGLIKEEAKIVPDVSIPPDAKIINSTNATQPLPIFVPKNWWELPMEKQSKRYGEYPEELQKRFQDLARGFAIKHGLDKETTIAYLATVDCESGWSPYVTHENIVVKNGIPRIASCDWGIVQVNDFYHVGNKLDFSSVAYVMSHPEECLEWCAKMFKANLGKLWVCYDKKLYQRPEHYDKFKV